MKHLFHHVRSLCALGLVVVAFLLGACTGIPERVEPVTGFQPQRYLGTWYEIARLPHPFEDGLSYVQATYTLQDNGTIDVLNQGFNAESGEWEQAEGVAKFVGARDVGHLKVSFFGPFYASYVVMALDKEDYQYSLVTGPDHDYLWLLSRTPEMDPEVQDRLVDQAREAGYPVDDLIWVEQSGQPPVPRP
ncbi:lipocalin family protein [Marinobacter nanhaiticus D15-8W]|uniref:lipocalin family protein n=1 Tax=Marinobacter nanhaiticus TaxID=1305740 RepID=UPI0002CB6650|nr:lipocalin family protein [Marinobacter nanhaiticus]BES71768.1 lipocalin family protein [Marinobacter nanhaiticus D15-8W]